MPTTVTKPPILDETGQDILTQLRRIADAKESNLMGYGGAVNFVDLPSPTPANLNIFYLIKDAFTTTTDFVVGPGVSESGGKYWAVINIGTEASPVCKYDEMGTLIDLSSKQDKVLSSPIVIGGVSQTTVEGALVGLNNGKVELNQGATNVGKTLVVSATGDLVLGNTTDDDIVTGSANYSAGASNCSVSINLESGLYAVTVYCPEEAVTKDNITYSSQVLTVTFKKKPTSNGALWAVARKVAN